MIFPKNGAIVIVDDNIKEIEPLIYYFTQRGVPTYISNGKDNTLPNEPITGVRLLFLDMELINTNDTRTVTTNLITVLKRIIGLNNGPYILIIWSTKNARYEEEFRDILLKESESLLNPISIISLEKEQIFESNSEELFDASDVTSYIYDKITNANFDIAIEDIKSIENFIKEELELVNKDDTKTIKASATEIISKEIDKTLIGFDSMELFFRWNNIVSDTDKALVTDMLQLVSFDNEHWNDFIKDTLEEMAAAEQGQSYKQGQMINIKSAFNILNELLFGNIANSLETEQSIYPSQYMYNDSSLHNISDVGQITFGKNKLISGNITFTDKEYYSLLIDKTGKDNLISNLNYPYDPKSPNFIKANLFKFKENLVNKRAKINTKLFFSENITTIKPGAIINIIDDKLKIDILFDLLNFDASLKVFNFEEEFNQKKSGLDQDSLNELILEYKHSIINRIIDETRILKLELTPPCDYSQKNMLTHRWLTGIKIPSKYIHLNVLTVKTSDHNTGKYYITKEYFNDGIFTIIFDKRRFHVTDIGDQNETSIKMMRDSMLNDIRDNVASHVGRKGILNL